MNIFKKFPSKIIWLKVKLTQRRYFIWQKKGQKEKRDSFTIIELIIVVAIIAILAAIILTNVTGYIQKSKDAKALAELRQITTIASGYYSNSGIFNGLYTDPEILKIENSIFANGYTVTMIDKGGALLNRVQRLNYVLSQYCSTDQWVAYFSLGTSKGCIDYSGYSGNTNANPPLCACYIPH